VRREKNVFDDLGFSSEEAAALTIKSKLHSQIVRCAKHYSQRQLKEILGEPQPRISDLLRGKIAKFSLETLVTYADALDMRPEIKTHPPVMTMIAASA
jgi:predicted XRE-type DNA-binding protein